MRAGTSPELRLRCQCSRKAVEERVSLGPLGAVRLLFLTVSMVLLWSDHAVSQAVGNVPDAVACARCSIVMRSRTVLGSLSDNATFPPGLPERVHRDLNGRYWLFSNAAPPALFDSSGSFLRMLGLKGKGPGEYIAPHDAFFLGDSVVVLDSRQRRASVLNRELQYVRAMVMPAQMYHTVVLSWPDSIIMSGWIPNAASVGRPLHLVSFARSNVDDVAAVVRSFGPGDGGARPSDSMVRTWYLAIAKDGFWSAAPGSYQLVKWKSSTLERLRTIRRDPSWFRGESNAAIGAAPRNGLPWIPPSPAVVGIEEDGEGLLWTYVRVPAQKWKDAWSRVKRDIDSGRQPRISDLRWEKLYDTRIEVLDPVVGRVLARTTLDGFFAISASRGRRLAVYATDDMRGETVKVLEFTLNRPRP